MKSAFIRICLFLGITCFVFSVDCQAQGTRIAIVSVADTTCVHRHVGLTIFTNFCDTIQMNFPLLQQMEGKLMAYLNTNYTASVVQLPDSVLKVKNTFFRQSRTKKIEQWIKNSKDQYDLVIVMDNMELSENDRLVPKSTSGIFSRTYFASYYTTISFFAYRTSNLKQLEYYHQGGNFMQPIKDFKLLENKKNFTPEVMKLLCDGFKNYLDSRVEHFLVKAYLVPQDKIDLIKAESGTKK